MTQESKRGRNWLVWSAVTLLLIYGIYQWLFNRGPASPPVRPPETAAPKPIAQARPPQPVAPPEPAPPPVVASAPPSSPPVPQPQPVAAPATDAAVPALTMPSFTRVGAHITTSVDVELKAVGLTSISFALRYDRSRLRLISVNVGELLSQSGAASSFTYDDPAPGGEIHGTLTAKSGGSGVAGAGSVVSAEFEAIAEGTAIISLQGLQIIRVNDQSSPVGSVAAQTITIGPKIDVPMVQFGNR